MLVEALIMLGISILSSLVWLWVGGIDYIKENESEYKGEAFFNDQDRKEIS